MKSWSDELGPSAGESQRVSPLRAIPQTACGPQAQQSLFSKLAVWGLPPLEEVLKAGVPDVRPKPFASQTGVVSSLPGVVCGALCRPLLGMCCGFVLMCSMCNHHSAVFEAFLLQKYETVHM